MKKKLMMKAQAIILAACVTFSACDMTAFATATSPAVSQTQETEGKDTTTVPDGTNTTTNTEETNVEGTSATEEETEDVKATQDLNSQESKINEELTDIENNEEINADTTISENELGIEDSNVGELNYNDIEDIVVPSIYDGSFVESQRGTLPASYSSVEKGYITPVKKQSPWGTCWAFSTIGMAEANIVRKGLADNTLDLSELQLAYFFYNTVADPLGNTTGDSTKAIGASYLERGGNNMYTTFSLASWTGVTLELKAPYESAAEDGTLDSALAYDDAYHMQNAYWINMRDKEDIKAKIMDYGAVATSYYHAVSNSEEALYYNSTNNAYYYNGSRDTNHGIVIVGWDDSFDKTKFTTQPTSNGAWLIKNSWGTSFGASGYFWISYEDARISNSTAFVFDFESANNYDHNYQYDGASGTGAWTKSVENGGSIANIFTVKANNVGAEQVEAVSFAMRDVNVDYSIQIYRNITDSQNPASGTPMLTTPKTGQTSYAGYYTVKLDEPISVSEGTKFSVVVTLSRSASSYVNYIYESTYNNSDWISFTSSSNEGQSFERMTPRTSWTDLNSYNQTARIKAFTSDIEEVQPTTVSLDSNSITMEIDETKTLNATLAPASVTESSIMWSSSDSNVAKVDANGIVTAKNIGTAIITATTTNGLTATCTLNVEEIKPKSISFRNNTIKDTGGVMMHPIVDILPSNANKNLTWSSSNESVATIDQDGLLTTIGVGTSTITATTVNGLTATCQVIVDAIYPRSVMLNIYGWNMKIGESITLSANLWPLNVTDKTMKWTTSDSNIAKVDSSGIVTAVAPGTATITGTAINGLNNTCIIVVKNPTQASSNISASQINLNINNISLEAGATTTLAATVLPSNATDRTVRWTTSDSSIATVGSNGEVTVTGIGTATITATTTNGLIATCQVTGTIGNLTGLTADAPSTKSIKLSWNKQNGVSGYEVYRYDNKKYKKIGTTNNANTTTYTNKSLKIATTYKYKVRAYAMVNGNTVYGPYSDVLETSTITATPTLNTKALSKSAKLTWGKITGANGYEVYMSTSKSSGYSVVKTITKGKTTSYTQKGLKKKTTYYYKIRAYKTVAGVKIYSSYSKVKSVKVK